jgi:isocitrate dehydrogenase kinase/phosphatase
MSELLQRSTRSAGNVASAIAQALVEGFTKHYRLFRQISREAKGRAPYLEYHADPLEPDFWNETKARIAAGHIADVFPYLDVARFKRRFHTDS